MESFEVLLMGGVAAVGFVGTAVYYFARFYMFKEEQSEYQRPSGAPKPQVAKSLSLSDALSKSKSSLWRKAGSDEEVSSLDELEETLYMADLGPQTVSFLIDQVKEKTKDSSGFNLDEVKGFFKAEMLNFFEEDKSENIYQRCLEGTDSGAPYVVSIVGINGAGKTTSIGKLASKFAKDGKKVMVAAGDTFRAAAESQLQIWAERSGALLFMAHESTRDPAAVAFQAYEKAKKEEVDILLIDTAGRLHTQDNLMKELEKVMRVLKKHDESAPHETWMVLDANTGMNAFFQAESFHKALGLSALIMTKVDGSAKAGTALGLRQALKVPIFMLGVGEQVEDLRLFNPQDFVDSLI